MTNYVTKEEWADWFTHPVTSKFFEKINEEREEALQRMAAGIYSEEPGKQNILIGMVNALTKILERQYAKGEEDV